MLHFSCAAESWRRAFVIFTVDFGLFALVHKMRGAAPRLSFVTVPLGAQDKKVRTSTFRCFAVEGCGSLARLGAASRLCLRGRMVGWNAACSWRLPGSYLGLTA